MCGVGDQRSDRGWLAQEGSMEKRRQRQSPMFSHSFCLNLGLGQWSDMCLGDFYSPFLSQHQYTSSRKPALISPALGFALGFPSIP
jgi:hypothetical protein